MYVYVCVGLCADKRRACESRKRVMGPQEIESQAVVTCPTRILGSELGFCTRAIHILDPLLQLISYKHPLDSEAD